MELLGDEIVRTGQMKRRIEKQKQREGKGQVEKKKKRGD